MSEHKTIAIAKLNRASWEAYRDELIVKFRAAGTLETYSDDMVRTNDTTYVVKYVKVDPYLLDPLLGFEGRCDAKDLKTFMDRQMEQLKSYLEVEVTAEPDVAAETGTVIPPVAGVTETGETVTPGEAVEKLKVFTGAKLDPVPEKVENGTVEPLQDPAESENLAPVSDETTKTDPNPVPGAEVKE